MTSSDGLHRSQVRIPQVSGLETFLLERLAAEVPQVEVRIAGRDAAVYAVVDGPACYAHYLVHLFERERGRAASED